MFIKKFSIILFFVEFISSQQTLIRAQLVAGAAEYASSTITTNSVLSSDNMEIDYYDVNGNRLHSSWYPFYSSNYNIPTDLMNNVTVNEYIRYLNNTYSIPMTDLNQMYSLIDSSIPTVTTNLEFHMLEDLTTYYQREKLNLMPTLHDYSLKSQTLCSLIEKQRNPTKLITIPIPILLVSCGYSKNYNAKHSLFNSLKLSSYITNRSRYFSYIFLPIWKICCLFSCILLFTFLKSENVRNKFSLIATSFFQLKVHVVEINSFKDGFALRNLADVVPTRDMSEIDANHNTIRHILLTQIVYAYLCYTFGKFAFNIIIQVLNYAFPVNLTILITLSWLTSACGLRQEDLRFFHNSIPNYLFFQLPSESFLNDFICRQYACVWLSWLLWQTWGILHFWTPKNERLATTEKLFELVNYEQDLNVNYETISIHTDASSTTPKTVKKSDGITRIYACATMWHETKEEIMEMLKSILRMDEDQCARRVAQKYLRVVDPDYYEFETHIFFDDGFEISDVNDDWSQVNRFVKTLVSTIDEAATHVHETNIRIRPPTKYPTPYGGRLVWTLPGRTKLFVHLKDKSKIRIRKRWSQVMYMYYLLGHRLMELPIPIDRKEVMAENTYLLTLDGDIHFQRHAVHLLIDLMKKNRNLGAVCGRIHPVGSGLMAWYQIFEYAIGHWFQKAAEHMLGCVLCSPGCFSLYRGKALIDENVMKKYTTKSEEARHYVQYDQGEDRWLCTLLLQRGYRVEYSAASDAYTHCPENFNEFYNQRRRWVPSTMANIMDLLMNYKRTIKINDNISLLYIIYQFMLMGGSVLGPGAIFLMLVDAFVAVFHIDNWTSFYYNIIPILFFIFVCFTCKSNVQLLVAQILSTTYALIMMAVIVGTGLQLQKDGLESLSAIFFISMLCSIFIAALLHPQEFKCIIFFSIYVLSIPSMHLLLILYSIINLNSVIWGTREINVKKTKKELEHEKKAEKEAKRKINLKMLLGFLQSNSENDDNEKGSLELSFADLFKCVFRFHQKTINEYEQILRIASSFNWMNKRRKNIEKALEEHGHLVKHRTASTVSASHLNTGALVLPENSSEVDEDTQNEDTASLKPKIERNDDINPYWIEDTDLKKGPVAFLSANENQFWKGLADKYLYPIDDDKVEKTRIATELKYLRDRSVVSFLMLNTLFVVIIFFLKMNKDMLHIKWPFGVEANVTYDETIQELFMTKEYLQIEPMGLVFFYFAFIMIIQFIAMIFHRFGTITHILASAELNYYNKKKNDLSQQATNIVKHLQRLKGINEEHKNDPGSSYDRVNQRRIIYNLEKEKHKTRTIRTLDDAFKKRFLQMKMEGGNSERTGTSVLGYKLSMRREVRKMLEARRKSLQAKYCKSQLQILRAKNKFVNNVNRSYRVSSASVSVKDIFEGHQNLGYEHDENNHSEQNSVHLQSMSRNNRSWSELERNNNQTRDAS